MTTLGSHVAICGVDENNTFLPGGSGAGVKLAVETNMQGKQ